MIKQVYRRRKLLYEILFLFVGLTNETCFCAIYIKQHIQKVVMNDFYSLYKKSGDVLDFIIDYHVRINMVNHYGRYEDKLTKARC